MMNKIKVGIFPMARCKLQPTLGVDSYVLFSCLVLIPSNPRCGFLGLFYFSLQIYFENFVLSFVLSFFLLLQLEL